MTVPNREATEKYGEGDPKTRNELAMPATGAYILKLWRADREPTFQRNPNNFRKGEPLLDGIIVPLLFGDPAAARIAYEQKQIDAWAGPDNNSTKAVLDQYKGQMWEVLTGVSNTVYFHLNMNQQFKDVRLVRAANLAIDRRSLIQSFHQGLGQVSGPVTWLQEGYAIPPNERASAAALASPARRQRATRLPLSASRRPRAAAMVVLPLSDSGAAIRTAGIAW